MSVTCTVRSCYYLCCYVIATVVLTVGVSHCGTEKEWQHTIIINAFKGTQNKMCYDSSGRSGPSKQISTCGDINTGFQFRNSSTKFILRPGIHYLSSSVLFNSVNQLAIIGDNGSNSTVVCRTGTGFSFINSTDITLQWVTYLGCGVLQNSTNKSFSTSTDTPRQLAAGLKLQKFLVSFHFYQCHDVILDHLTIANSSSRLVMYETTGDIMVMNSIFYDNSLGSHHSDGGGGGEEFANASFCKPEKMSTTGLNPSNNNNVDTVESPQWQNIQTQECLPGLTVNTTPDATCQCSSPHPYGGQVMCSMAMDGDDYTCKVDVRNGVWIGNISDSNLTLYIGECFYFCGTNNTENFYPLRNVCVADLDSYVCGVNHRTGVLCGKCIEGYGPAVNDWDRFTCVACDDSDLARRTVKYFFATYVPLFFLFLAIIVFKVQLTTGPANAFLLYAQMISSAFEVNAAEGVSLNAAFSRRKVRWMLNGYYFVYGIFNLEFFSYLLNPYCLTQSFNNLDVLQLQYGVALFPLFMITAVLLFLKLKESGCFSRCTQRFQNQTTNTQDSEASGWKFADNLLHAFVAFTLLSYTKFGTSSTFILSVTPLSGEDGKPNGTSRVYFAGQYRIDQKEYLYPYALPAGIVLVFVALPPLLLLGPLQWFNQLVVPRVSCLRRYWPSVKMNIVLDAFQGCYKPHTRFFAGLYFLFRLAVLANYASTTSIFQQYVIQQILATVMVALLAIFQPYRRQLFNYVDTLIFLNMAIMNSLCILIFASSEINPQTPFPMATFIILYIMVYLPLVYIISYILYYCYQKKVVRQLKLWCKSCCCQKISPSSQPLLDVASKDFPRSKYGSLINDTSFFARSKETNTFKPSPSIRRAAGLSSKDAGMKPSSANATPSSTQSMEDTPYDSLPNANDCALHISQLEQ